MTIETRAVVEAALLPELFFSVAEKSLKDDDAKTVIDKLKDDVLLYKSVLSVQAQDTFDRFVDKTCNEVLLSLYDKQRDGWDAVTCFSTFLEVTSRLAEKGQLKITDDFAFAVRTISEKMAEQHGDVWNGMLKAAGKRSDKVMNIFNKRGYYV